MHFESTKSSCTLNRVSENLDSEVLWIRQTFTMHKEWYSHLTASFRVHFSYAITQRMLLANVRSFKSEDKLEANKVKQEDMKSAHSSIDTTSLHFTSNERNTMIFPIKTSRENHKNRNDYNKCLKALRPREINFIALYVFIQPTPRREK